MVHSENAHICVFIQTEQVIFSNMYIYIYLYITTLSGKEDTNLEASKSIWEHLEGGKGRGNGIIIL